MTKQELLTLKPKTLIVVTSNRCPKFVGKVLVFLWSRERNLGPLDDVCWGAFRNIYGNSGEGTVFFLSNEVALLS